MSINTFMVADSIVDTIKFDFLDLNTDKVVQNNGVDVTPSFDFIGMPTGIGFKQNVDTVEGDTIDYVVNQIIKKKNIKLQVYWKGSNAYQKYQSFNKLISMYLDVNKYHVRFSYEVSSVRRYVEVSIVDLELQGRDGRYTSATITMQPLTLWYEENSISFTMVSSANSGKIYNYSYPYTYGGGSYSDNNIIKNEFIKKMPLKIVIHGPASSPIMVSICEIDEDGNAGSEYARVQFVSGFSINAKQTLTIDAFNNKIYLTTINDQTGVVSVDDAFNSVDKSHDSFLFANPGQTKVSTNALTTTQSSITCSYKRYVL